MKKAVLFSTFMSVALLTGCCASDDYQTDSSKLTSTGVKPFKVTLIVNTSTNELTPKDRGINPDCSPKFDDKLKKACFVAEVGEMLEMEFRLQQPSGATKWRFTKVMICSGTTKPNDCSLTPSQRADFVIEANNEVELMPGNGTIDLTSFSQQLRVFSIRDFNWLEHNYIYKIEACKEGSTDKDDCVWMDPGGTNKGRGLS